MAPCEVEALFESQYNHFYLREAIPNVRAEELLDQINSVNKSNFDEEVDTSHLEKELDDILMKQERVNEDNFSLSHSLKQRVRVKADASSLLPPSKKNPETVFEHELDDAAFLDYRRRRAETVLIKSKIMHKVDKDVPLTANEQAYLRQWTSNPSKESLLGQHAMVPEKPSSLRLDSITHKDLETLNGISQVEFSAERHGHFALNDLVVELGVFLDSDTVNRVDLTCFEHGMSQAWGLSPHELPVDLGANSANKESALVRLELEEMAWREAAKFTEDEGERILDLTNVGRYDDALEKRFKELDAESFYDFMGQVNEKDDRIDLVENWLTRKEQEVMSRVNGVEGTDLDKTDQQIFN